MNVSIYIYIQYYHAVFDLVHQITHVVIIIVQHGQ